MVSCEIKAFDVRREQDPESEEYVTAPYVVRSNIIELRRTWNILPHHVRFHSTKALRVSSNPVKSFETCNDGLTQFRVQKLLYSSKWVEQVPQLSTIIPLRPHISDYSMGNKLLEIENQYASNINSHFHSQKLIGKFPCFTQDNNTPWLINLSSEKWKSREMVFNHSQILGLSGVTCRP